MSISVVPRSAGQPSECLLEPLVGPDSQWLTPQKHKQRERNAQHKTQNATERITPSVSQLLVHGISKQGESKTKQTSKHGSCRNTASRVPRVHVNQVVLDRLEQAHNTETVDTCANARHEPENAGFGRPAVPNETNAHKGTAGDQKRDAELGLGDTIVALGEFVEHVLHARRPHQEANEKANSKTEIHKARDSDAESVVLDPEHRVGDEKEVHESVNKGHVQTETEHNGVEHKQLNRPSDCVEKLPAEIKRGDFKDRVKMRITSFLSQSVSLPVEQSGWVGLLEENDTEEGNDSSSYSQDPNNPLPFCVLDDEASNYWSKYRTDGGASTENSDSEVTLIFCEQICNSTCTDRQGRGTRTSSQKSKHQELSCVL